ncbi:trypsin-like peptidase domain-containing protein [Deltaproteobacteria bacterium OttesenSCG-928-M10]|nr:trypsin-like peptidase domain-containing protein [Deltaproteobacteria bacterium OttesenSCG-928-M10]
MIDNTRKHFHFVTTLAMTLLLLAGLTATAAQAQTPFEPLKPGAPGLEGRRTPIVAAIEKARPAVVSVYAQINTGGSRLSRDPFHDEFFDRFFGDMYRRRARPGISLGSGVIIDGAKGLLVTNEHVVRNAAAITVTLTDGSELPAEIIGSDPRFDLAVLKIKTQKTLPSLPLAPSDDLMIGETVIAIGNPFGLSHTATTGVVSATGRTMPGSRNNSEGLRDLIQTDASINPGNSGGPLLNINGAIVGINTAILAGGEGLGFAIPAGQVKRITARLMRGDSAATGLDLGLELAEAGKPQRGETGCLVVTVKPGGPGDLGGLKKGDMLMKLDGSPTATISDYEIILSSLAPGQAALAEVLRGDRTISLTLTPKAISEAEALNLAWTLYGLKVYESRGRLVLERPADKSPAAALGLREGDLLISFAGKDMAAKSDLAKVIIDTRFQTSAALAVQRGRTLYQTTISR